MSVSTAQTAPRGRAPHPERLVVVLRKQLVARLAEFALDRREPVLGVDHLGAQLRLLSADLGALGGARHALGDHVPHRAAAALVVARAAARGRVDLAPVRVLLPVVLGRLLLVQRSGPRHGRRHFSSPARARGSGASGAATMGDARGPGQLGLEFGDLLRELVVRLLCAARERREEAHGDGGLAGGERDHLRRG